MPSGETLYTSCKKVKYGASSMTGTKADTAIFTPTNEATEFYVVEYGLRY